MKLDKEAFAIGQFHSKYIGDDGAVIGDMVYSMDAFHEDIHFKRAWMTPAQIARKAMLVNISDAVAMNADPLYVLVSLAIPQEMPYDEIASLAASLETTAGEYGAQIIGGDTVGGDKLHLSLTLISQSKDPLMRCGIKEGDLLAYTGTLGMVKRDLDRLFRNETIEADSRFFEPTLRRSFVKQARPFLRSGMDISDGLFCDTGKLLDANGLGLELLAQIPDSIGLSGEEYEMLVGFAPEVLEQLLEIAKATDTPLTVFAKVVRNDIRLPCKSHHFKN